MQRCCCLDAGREGENTIRPEDYDAFLSSGMTAEMNSADYWISLAKKPDKVLLTSQKIQQFNQQILAQEGCYDIFNAPAELKKAELSALLLKTAIPDSPRYIDETAVDETYYTSLMANVNLAGVEETNLVSYGVIADNAPLRAFPDQRSSYARPRRPGARSVPADHPQDLGAGPGAPPVPGWTVVLRSELL